MTLMRLQKFLSVAGVCSRRKGETLISEGHVSVNGRVVVTQGQKVDPASDRVEVDGRHVVLEENYVYIALNKPVNVETTCRQKGRTRSVLDLVTIPERVFPIGRLDKDSEGLLIMTNDGRIHHRLSHPSFEHEKEYLVTTKKRVGDDSLRSMAAGMSLEEFDTRPCSIQRIAGKQFNIVLKEGKNRQIRKMVQATGNDVTVLKRIRISNIRLGNLKPGHWRYLTEKEIRLLLVQAGVEHERKKTVARKVVRTK